MGGLAAYRRAIESSFVLRDHKKLRRAPGLMLSDRVQHAYPHVLCDLAESLFTVVNPTPKVGVLRAARSQLQANGLHVRHVVRDAWTALRTFG